MTNELTFVIFGSTGDLARRKLIPALNYLKEQKHLGCCFNVVAVGRRDMSDSDYREYAKEFLDSDSILGNLTYFRGDISSDGGLSGLDDYLSKVEGNKLTNRIYYLSTGQEFFDNIVKELKRMNLHRESKSFRRIAFEKPFGENKKSAQKIDTCIKNAFTEEQIYRVDHYLGKETVQNIFALRFANPVFESIWVNDHISNIQIIIDEELGVENRGLYYDHYGAIKDIIQNHALQLLAYLTMEPPKDLSANSIIDQKIKLLNSIKTTNEFVLGQYKGYKSEKHILRGSTTETFAAIKLDINNKRFKGVPVFIRTGKSLAKKQSKIIIEFKNDDIIFPDVEPNKLIIMIQPQGDIVFEINHKKPQESYFVTNSLVRNGHSKPSKAIEFDKVPMNFCYDCHFKENSPQNYERLFLDIVSGDKSLFINIEELIASWKIVDLIKQRISKNNIKLHSYSKGSNGPKESDSLLLKHKTKWCLK